MTKKIVLIHGALGAGQQLDRLAASLSAGAHEVAIYEFPGHGKRAAEEVVFTIGSLADDFHRWLNEKYTAPVDVFGYSMGGYVSLYLALSQPQLFGKILTLGTKFKWSVAESEKETAKLDPGFLLQKAPDYCNYLAALHGETYWKQVLRETAGLMNVLGNDPLLNEKTLPTLEVPVCLMRGSHDKMVTKDETLWAQSLIRQSVSREIEGFVHPLERIDQQQLAGEILKP